MSHKDTKRCNKNSPEAKSWTLIQVVPCLSFLLVNQELIVGLAHLRWGDTMIHLPFIPCCVAYQGFPPSSFDLKHGERNRNTGKEIEWKQNYTDNGYWDLTKHSLVVNIPWFPMISLKCRCRYFFCSVALLPWSRHRQSCSWSSGQSVPENGCVING